MKPTQHTRRDFLRTGTAITGAAALTGSPLQSALAGPANGSGAIGGRAKPNFLFVIADQLGLDAIGAHGRKDVRTPNLDRIINTGTTFIESHSTNPVCSPARSSLMTGRMPQETGVTTNGLPIHPDCPTIGHVLGSQGYDAYYCGKWHLPGPIPGPDDGFTVLPARGGQGDIDDEAISRTSEGFIRSRTGNKTPWLMVSSFLQPHDICFWGNHEGARLPDGLPFPDAEELLPELPPNLRSRPKEPKGFVNLFKERTDLQWQYYLYVYARMIEMLDADVGRLLTALDATGQADNTIIVFTSDHGDGQGRHSHVSKWYPYDESVKVPLCITCPGLLPEGVRDTRHLVSGCDIMPTLCDYAGVKPPQRLQGLSLRPVLEESDPTWRDYVVSEVQRQCFVLRTERYKYVHFEDDPVEQLFDMKQDPWETVNQYENPEFSGILDEHRRLLAEYHTTIKPVPASKAPAAAKINRSAAQGANRPAAAQNRPGTATPRRRPAAGEIE